MVVPRNVPSSGATDLVSDATRAHHPGPLRRGASRRYLVASQRHSPDRRGRQSCHRLEGARSKTSLAWSLSWSVSRLPGCWCMIAAEA